MYHFLKPIFLFLFYCLAIQACVPGDGPSSDKDQLLAEVYNKTLSLSELEGMIPEGMSSEDSALIINAYLERWMRDAVMMHEAEKSIPQDLNIDKLVRDYRASLIRYNYEKVLVEQLLDSTITQQELNAFYQKNKEQYQLETPIVRCLLIKVPLSAPNLSKLQRWWNSDKPTDFDAMVAYANNHATIHQLEYSTWFQVADIASFLPPGTLTEGNISTKKDFIIRDEGFQYFFKVLEVVSKKEIAPLSYIEYQATKVILHNRKIKLLEDRKEQMYKDALRRNNVRVFK